MRVMPQQCGRNLSRAGGPHGLKLSTMHAEIDFSMNWTCAAHGPMLPLLKEELPAEQQWEVVVLLAQLSTENPEEEDFVFHYDCSVHSKLLE